MRSNYIFKKSFFIIFAILIFAGNVFAGAWVSPAMSGINLPVPYVVSVSHSWNDSVLFWQTMDGNLIDGGWSSSNEGSANSWYQLFLGNATTVVVKGFWIKNNQGYGVEQFKIQGLTDTGVWFDIFIGNCSNNSNVQTFSFSSNETIYKNIRFRAVSGYYSFGLGIIEIGFTGDTGVIVSVFEIGLLGLVSGLCFVLGLRA